MTEHLQEQIENLKKYGLYDPQMEHDACGVGFVCQIDGQPSHSIIEMGLEVLNNLDHRGARGCDPDTGDGAGILVSMPDKFLRRECSSLGIKLPPMGEYAAAQIFLPSNDNYRIQHETIFEKIVSDFDMELLGWRDVPVNSSHIGELARSCEPRIRQCFIGMKSSFFNRRDFERRLYLVRQRAENFCEEVCVPGTDQFYVCALSTNRMVYKGMLTTQQLSEYFPDLQDPDFQSHLALVHSRFSTNTFPSWWLAHPYRYIAHNGEINTLRGNRNWMRARRGSLNSPTFGTELDKMFPIFSESQSDSATLDSALQFLVLNGRPIEQAVLMLIPEAWENHQQMDPDLKAFYEYHSCLMEPWDGPAAMAFSDGTVVGAVLDRNGLRPARYIETHDGLVIMASEVGVLDIEPERVKHKWRLEPGKIFLVDTRQGRIIEDEEIKRDLINKRPWSRWLEENLLNLNKIPPVEPAPHHTDECLVTLQKAFGYTEEQINMVVVPMAEDGTEPIGSMGNDTPLACLSEKPQLLFNYFKQLFAQVTNPPLDAIREELVTSLLTNLGSEGNLLDETPAQCRVLRLSSPILTNKELESIRQYKNPSLKTVTISTLYTAKDGFKGFQEALDRIRCESTEAIKQGASILVLSDRGVNNEQIPLPSLLSAAGVHHHLIREGSRTKASIVCETGEAREVHHFCLLIGYGVAAVNPWLAFETIAEYQEKGLLGEGKNVEALVKNYVKAINKGILKVSSKMGISTVASYRGAQIFEAIGLSKDVISEFFTNTTSRLEGLDLEIIEKECAFRHQAAYPEFSTRGPVLESGGSYKWRRDGEHHMWNPETIATLQHSVSGDNFDTFKKFSKVSNDESRTRCTLRGLMDFKKSSTSVPIDEVESAKEIVKRFVTGAMSFGSISPEAHENLAKAMNFLGGKSNTGEGGENPERFLDDRRSAIKQVASGRFGVTIEYLVNADEIQIKMAQGAKPGEGGHLPGHKVNKMIASVRHSTPGVGLISPPPHHDIYSIEDLAQLIHDLKNANPKARISVKLVSEVGVGTVAAGVSKGKADHILISGDSGGTGASPLTSIKHAGIPWELGLSETQQVLVTNDLRGRVVIQVDGQLKTGRDVVIGALLGGEEFGFSTAPLIASGCIMMRKCHLNTCPVGVATQDSELRKKFKGTPENIIRYFFYVAEEVREIMAKLGFRKIEEMVGRTDKLFFNIPKEHWKASLLDFEAILYRPTVSDSVNVSCRETQDHGLAKALDNKLIELAAPALEDQQKVNARLSIRNINRTVGTMLSSTIAKRYGQKGLPEDTINVIFEGTAGQSFGAFLSHGVSFTLFGDVNDYLGKGLSGGKIVVRPPLKSHFASEKNIIAGNVICYGAIEGEVYLRGVVGERFCVRNSGAKAVVEGVGDHGCEYMTGGRVVVIGQTGRNFAAGMSGGIAYVYDPDNKFTVLCNMEMVDLETPNNQEDQKTIQTLLQNHVKYTDSCIAKGLLESWSESFSHFVKVMPRDYRRVLEEQADETSKKAGA